MKISCLVILLIQITFKSFSSNIIEGVFQGSIGNYPIVISLEFNTNDNENTYSGTYFYKKQKKDIKFSGITEKGEIVLKVLGENNNIKEVFSIREVQSTLQGSWKSGNKVLNVSLTKVTSLNDIRHNFAHLPSVQKSKRENNFYSYIRTSDLVLKKADSVSNFMNHQLSWLIDGKSEILFFRVDSGYPEHILKQINYFLEEKQLEHLENYYSCETNDYSISVFPSFINDQYFSFYINNSYFCGGAHPDFEQSNFTFNVGNRITALTLEDFLYFKEGSPPREDSDAWSKYREDDFVPKITQILKKRYPKEMKADKNCNPSEFWNYCNWHLTSKGLYISNDPPHVVEACAVDFIIPYGEISKFGKGKYPFPNTK